MQAGWRVVGDAMVRRWWETCQPGTTLDILVKDLRCVQSCAADAGLSLPVAACVLERILGAWPPK